MRCPLPRTRSLVQITTHNARIVLAWTALVVLLPHRAIASATLGDTIIRARLPTARAELASDYMCTAVALPADPLKLVKVVPAAVGTATDMLLYGTLRPAASVAALLHACYAAAPGLRTQLQCSHRGDGRSMLAHCCWSIRLACVNESLDRFGHVARVYFLWTSSVESATHGS